MKPSESAEFMDVMKRRRSCPLPYLYIILRGSLCFEAFADERTFVEPLSRDPICRDEIPRIFLFYFISFNGTFDFSAIFFLSSRWSNLMVCPGWWDDRGLCRVDHWENSNFAVGKFRATSGEIAKIGFGSESGKFGRDRTSNKISRPRPSPPEFCRVTPNLGIPRILKCVETRRRCFRVARISLNFFLRIFSSEISSNLIWKFWNELFHCVVLWKLLIWFNPFIDIIQFDAGIIFKSNDNNEVDRQNIAVISRGIEPRKKEHRLMIKKKKKYA